MKRYPVIFTIAGSDSTGGAGIQADIKTISALGAYAASALTSIAVQNTLGIKDLHSIPRDVIRAQIEVIMEDMSPDVVKIGLINSADSARVIADCLRKYHPRYVVFDPVMLALGGQKMDKENVKIMQDELFPYTNLLTINLSEAEVLTGTTISTKEDLKKAAEILSGKHRIPVLAKGVNLLKERTYDILVIPDGVKWEYIGPRIETENTHGASCTFSAAIATYLAMGETLNEAVKKAREYIQEAIDMGKDVTIGRGKGPLCHSWNPVRMQIYGIQ